MLLVMRPSLVLIGGTHGAGKTTLAVLLSARLNWPLVSRDLVRGGAAWTACEVEHEPAGELSRQTVATFFQLIRVHLDAGISLVADSVFRRGVSERDLAPMLDAADFRWVHCRVSRDLAIERCRQRPGIDIAAMLEERDEGRWERVEHPLDLPMAVLEVDTSDGYEPGLPAIVDFARNHS